MTQKSPNQIVFEKAYHWAGKELEEIKVNPHDYHGNQKCHEVAFNNAYSKKDKIVVVLMFIPRSGVRIHLINHHRDKNSNTEYYDDTLGYLSKYNKFYKLAEFSWDNLKDYDHPQGASYLLMEFKMTVLNLLFTPEKQTKLGVSTENI